ncbi:hypothetical protein AAFF_G00011840 [Aldrovandia affinis]|uniref:Uncharacterized protein n=1 Tax=Aldrovandia affinis TaxID=143900 RepID=A0AAD7S8T1_9TELE|nr:hypothetical protein AAFF_G00011840 [Aldrovandia affinis]
MLLGKSAGVVARPCLVVESEPRRGSGTEAESEPQTDMLSEGLSAALARAARTRCPRVSRFEGRHCGPLSCPWPGLNGPFDGRPGACHRAPCPGAERRLKAQNTWQKMRPSSSPKPPSEGEGEIQYRRSRYRAYGGSSGASMDE